jgi:hypothetical protein
MKKAWRYWLTGGLAAVLAASVQADDTPDELRARHSRYSVGETVHRIEDHAREQGLPVFIKLAKGADGASSTLVVLGCDSDHTPVAQALPDGPVEMPLTLRIAPTPRGGAEVRFTDTRWLEAHPDAPGELPALLQRMGSIVDAAVG